MADKIIATIQDLSKKGMWIVKVLEVNKKKFCGKKGEILSSKERDYWGYIEKFGEIKYGVVGLEENYNPDDMNILFEKIKQLSIPQDLISFQFDFGWGNDFFGKTLEEVEDKIKDKLNCCREHIEKARKSEEAITNLLKEFQEFKNKEKK